MKLIEITFVSTPRIPSLRASDMQVISCYNPNQALLGWRVSIRGATVYLISPPGWRNGQHRADERDTNGPCIMHEIPRMNCFFQWSGSPKELVDVAKQFDSPAFGPELVEEMVASEPEAKGLLSQVGL